MFGQTRGTATSAGFWPVTATTRSGGFRSRMNHLTHRTAFTYSEGRDMDRATGLGLLFYGLLGHNFLLDHFT